MQSAFVPELVPMTLCESSLQLCHSWTAKTTQRLQQLILLCRCAVGVAKLLVAQAVTQALQKQPPIPVLLQVLIQYCIAAHDTAVLEPADIGQCLAL